MTHEEAIRRIEEHMIHHHMREYPHIFIGEALEIAIAALREQCVRDVTETSGWISVEERLPEIESFVLCRLKGGFSMEETHKFADIERQTNTLTILILPITETDSRMSPIGCRCQSRRRWKYEV